MFGALLTFDMKKIFILLGIVLASVTLSAQPLKRSQIVRDSVKSVILDETVNVNVYLPAGYDASSDRLYPVVYLLHGLYGGYSDWARKGHMKEVVDELIASGEAARMVIVMPNAGDEDVHNVWNGYFNVPGHNYEDFFFGELVPQIEKRYHAVGDKRHRAIMGLSMGGGGSTVYAQRHPDMFSSCYAMSAWLDNPEVKDAKPGDKLAVVQNSVHEHSALSFVDNADEATLEQLRSVRWFLDCGDDDFLLDLSCELYRKMRNKGVKCELRVRDGWHSWEYWHQALRLALPFASRGFCAE